MMTIKTALITAAVAVAFLTVPARPALAQFTALKNPPACKIERCLRNCVRNHLQRNCHQRCRRCT